MHQRQWNLLTLGLGAAAMLSAFSTLAVYTGVLTRIASNAHGATGDFLSFFGAGYLVRTGRTADLYDPAVLDAVQRQLYPGTFDEAIGYPLPVFVAWLFAPLSLLPFTLAFFIFMGLMTAVLLTVCSIFRRLTGGVPAGPRHLLLACIACSTPTVASIVFGQVDLVALLGLALGFLCLTNRKPYLAGAALCLVLVKPHMLAGVGLLLLFRKDWRTLSALAGLGLPLLVLPALLTAPGALVENVRILVSYPGADKELAVNAAVMPNWRGLIVSITNSNQALYWLPGFVALAGATLALTVRQWRRSADFAQSYALAAALPLLLSPHAHTQNLVLLWLPAILYGAALFRTENPRIQPAIHAVLAAYALSFVLPLLAILGLSLGVVLVVCVWAGVAFAWPSVPQEAAVAAGQPGSLRKAA